MDKRLLLFIFVLMMLTPLSAFSTTATTTFSITALISASCNISASTLSFGSYNPTLSSNLDGTTTVSVTCTNGTLYNVGLDAGTTSGATVSNRLMTSGAQTIAYTLYQDSARTTVWGNTVSTNTVAGTGTGNAQPLTVYGRIFSSNSTSLLPASYSDTVTATVTY